MKKSAALVVLALASALALPPSAFAEDGKKLHAVGGKPPTKSVGAPAKSAGASDHHGKAATTMKDRKLDARKPAAADAAPPPTLRSSEPPADAANQDLGGFVGGLIGGAINTLTAPR
jgi:hypothetical protein